MAPSLNWLHLFSSAEIPRDFTVSLSVILIAQRNGLTTPLSIGGGVYMMRPSVYIMRAAD